MTALEKLVHCRPGLLGPSFEAALELIDQYVPLQYLTADTGERIGTWVVPQAWECRRYKLIRSDGKVIIEGATSDDAVFQHSVSIDLENLSFEEIVDHLDICELEEDRRLVVAYYSSRWGFSLSASEGKLVKPGFSYHAVIESSFKNSRMCVGYHTLKGFGPYTILIDSVLSFYGLANNLTGVVAAIDLFGKLSAMEQRYFNYIFTFGPETAGVSLILAKKPELMNVLAGLTLMSLATPGQMKYKKSRRGDTVLDVLFSANVATEMAMIDDVEPYNVKTGYTCNEKALNALGLPGVVGRLVSELPGKSKRYDTSADNLAALNKEALRQNCDGLFKAMMANEMAHTYIPVIKGEPFLSGLGFGEIFKSSAQRSLCDELLSALNSKPEMLKFLSANLGSLEEVLRLLKKFESRNMVCVDNLEQFISENLFYRPLDVEDATEAYASWLGDEDVVQFLETSSSSVASVKSFIAEKKAAEDCLLLGIFDRVTLNHIGNIKLEPIDFESQTATLGIMIGDKSYWGRGVGFEATSSVHKYCSETLGLTSINLGVLERNKGAIALYEKCGYQLKGSGKIFRPKTNQHEPELYMEISL